MEQVKLKPDDSDTINSSKVFENSFLSNGKFSCQYFEIMRYSWVNIEDDAVVIDAIIDKDG